TGDVPPVGQAVLIDGGGTATVTFDPAATGMLLDAHAANTTLKAVTFTGGAAAATVLNLAGSGDHLDTVTVKDAPGTGARIGAASVRIDGSQFQNTGPGIVVSGSNATIATPVISGTNGNGITINAGAASV